MKVKVKNILTATRIDTAEQAKQALRRATVPPAAEFTELYDHNYIGDYLIESSPNCIFIWPGSKFDETYEVIDEQDGK